MRLRLMAAFAALLTISPALVLANASAGTAAQAVSAASTPDYGLVGTGLTIEPYFEGGLSTITVDTFERREALPQYTLRLKSVATGAESATKYGSARYNNSWDTYESDWNAVTVSPLVPGETYEAFFRITTTAHWACSQYDPNGCSWVEAKNDSGRWRFVFQPDTAIAAQYYVPPLAKSALVLGKKVKWGKQGWTISVQLTRNGVASAGARIESQYRTRGAWRIDLRGKTDAKGFVRVRFRGEPRATQYRFVYDGNESTTRAISRSFSVRARR